MADVKSALEDIKKYDKNATEEFVAKVFKGCGPSVYKKDAASVACSDKKELETVRNNYLIKKLGLEDSPELDDAIKEVCETMKDQRMKSRVTFYYLLCKKFGKESVYG